MTILTPARAHRMATSTLSHLGRVYPHVQQHWLASAADALPPDRLHPVFHGSLDWHSCVHGWWQVMRLARLFPAEPFAAQVRARADAMLVPDAIAGELAYFERAGASFERPYGWAWLLALHGELARADDPRWAAAVAPLARLIAARFATYLPILGWPVRHGVHSNTAFALILARRWAVAHDPALAALIDARARDWFGGDRAAPWIEPSGEDFLSPALVAALLMAEVLEPDAHRSWFATYADAATLAPLREPVAVSDRSDPRIAHLDGLNLSRAWCWSRLGEPDVAARHLDAALPHLADDYMGEHWLATFALLALTD